ncbi:MAG: hypothetical protein VCC04_15955 [Myxococcota bacterium]
MLSALIFVLTATTPFGMGTAHAGEYSNATVAKSVGMSLFYTPAKACYAVLGGTTAGLAYLFTLGDKDVLDSIWTPSVKGSYYVTPAMAAGDEPIEFKGR